MSNILVIAADKTCARIFKATSSKGPLEEKRSAGASGK